MAGVQHFDGIALLQAVAQQPYGLLVSTNHPAGFRRILYLASRSKPDLRCRILQSPKSRTAFLLVPHSVDPAAVAAEMENDNGA